MRVYSSSGEFLIAAQLKSKIKYVWIIMPVSVLDGVISTSVTTISTSVSPISQKLMNLQ